MYMDPDYMSVDDIKEGVVNLGYFEESIKEMYFSRPNVPFEDSLVPSKIDKQIRELTKLCLESGSVSLYVEHNDDEVIDKGKGVFDEEAHFSGLSYSDDDKHDSDGWINFDDDDDPEFIDVREKTKATKEAIAIKVEDGRGNTVNVEHEGELDAEGGDERYQDSNNANSPSNDLSLIHI